MRRASRPKPTTARACVLAACAIAAIGCASPSNAREPVGTVDAATPRNAFGDPFERVTAGIADCPEPLGPRITETERNAQAHQRAERGTSCWLEGRCATPNAYADDARIAERIAEVLRGVPRLGDTSLWITVQRRFAWVQGCVHDRAQRRAIERSLAALRKRAHARPRGDARVDRAPSRDTPEQAFVDLRVGEAGRVPYATLRGR